MDETGRMSNSSLGKGIEDRARTALASSPIHALRELQVQQLEHCLLVSGRVDSYYLKQLAQEVVRTVAEGLHVVNEVDVD